MKRGAATADRRGMRCLLVGGKFLLKAPDPFPQSDPAAADTLGHRSHFGFTHQWSAKDNAILSRAHRRAASYRRKVVFVSDGMWGPAPRLAGIHEEFSTGVILQDTARVKVIAAVAETSLCWPKTASYTACEEQASMSQVSVIINVLNGAATLREAVDSVLAQTFADWELIVWDDCSTDGSADTLSCCTDSRIRCVRSEERIPLGQARQRAIDLARGEWIAFLDQDDLWLPHKLELQMVLARGHSEVALIYGRTVRFYPSGVERDYDQAHEYTFLPEGDIFTDLFTDSCFIAMSSAMFRRSALAEVGSIPDSITIIPDYYLYTAVTRRFPAAAVQQVVCRYRMHSANTSRVTALQVQQEALRLMDMWRAAVAPAILARCRRRHSTSIALLEMRQPRTFFHGTWRLLTEGSLVSQLLRPFYFIFHLVRRNARPPLWKTLSRDTEPYEAINSAPVGK